LEGSRAGREWGEIWLGLQDVAMRCSALQCVAVCCSELQKALGGSGERPERDVRLLG